ncbi:MAG TPA: efflux RND transporter permease subunit, partial [Coxiellaceae bacterium]|nr:efflux RND transporter permease subunit [Coxiellaceae bacterium]
MNVFDFCIKRPVFATVLSLILIVIGIMGYHNLRTRFFPKFEPAKVFVMTSYAGASAKLVENTITIPLEKSLSGLEGVDNVTSTSSQGSSNIEVMLKPNVDIYNTANRIRNQIAMAAASLPATIHAPLVQIGHGDIVLMDVGFSTTDNELKPLRDYLDRYVIHRVEQLPGISTVDVLGANKSVMRITLHPDQMTALHVTTEDIQQAINNNNLQLPAGFIETPDMSFPVTAKTALHTIAQFSDVVVKNVNGQPIYLKDVATVTLGSDIASQSIIHINGQRAILLTIYNSEDANPITASKNVRQLLEDIKKQLPSNIK